MTRLDQYENLYEDVLAIPVLRGRKPDHDKFPGADTTTTVEALMPDGKSVQGATSHYLGQSFAEAYDVTYVDENEDEQTAHTTSWGLSWRSLGALVMTHSDDQGLVLPPALAPEQVVIVPIWQEDTKEEVLDYAEELALDLDEEFRVHLDDRDERNPGFKYNEWELKGVPLRIEVGPNEVDDEEVTLVHRPDGETETADRDDLDETVEDHLDTVFAKLKADAEENLEENVREAHSREDILGTIGQHGGYVKAPWCGDEDCEDPIKEAIAAEIVMVPMDPDAEPIGDDCAICGEDATETAYFAKSY
jgi:prolyl-tRNA synthetase